MQLRLCTDGVRTYFRITRTVQGVPCRRTRIVRLCRRCLHSREAGILDTLQRCLYVRVLPVKAVENGSLLDGFHLGECSALPKEHERKENTEPSENLLHFRFFIIGFYSLCLSYDKLLAVADVDAAAERVLGIVEAADDSYTLAAKVVDTAGMGNGLGDTADARSR